MTQTQINLPASPDGGPIQVYFSASTAYLNISICLSLAKTRWHSQHKVPFTHRQSSIGRPASTRFPSSPHRERAYPFLARSVGCTCCLGGRTHHQTLEATANHQLTFPLPVDHRPEWPVHLRRTWRRSVCAPTFVQPRFHLSKLKYRTPIDFHSGGASPIASSCDAPTCLQLFIDEGPRLSRKISITSVHT